MKKKITKLIMKAGFLLFLEVVMSICVNICVTRGSAMISTLVDDMLHGTELDYAGLLSVFVVLVAAGFLAAFIRKFCAGTFANKVCSGYRKIISEKLYRIQYQYILENNTGTILNKIIGDIGEVESMLDTTLPDIISNLVATIVYAVFIAQMDFKLFAVMAVAYPFIFWIANQFAQKMKKLSRTHREKTDAMADIAQSAVSGILIVRAFGLEKIFRGKMDDAADALVENEQRRTSITNTTMVIRQMLQWLPNIICALYAAYLVSQGNLSFGNLMAFVLVLSKFVDSFVGLPFMFVDAASGMVSMERIENILAQKDEYNGSYKGENGSGGRNVIEFDNVSFAYGSEAVLKNVNLTVSHHDNIALIGESGGGKTTLISLLCGLYDSFEGDIRIWGESITKWDKAALRDRISLVSQDVFLFPVSIEENVAFGLEGATHDEVVKACQEADIHDFIESLPDGYNTVIGERGTRLSGGEKQRLSIARAILKDAPILIMDEPTSSIDVETENEIQKEIEKLGADKTCITIAHRLNTIKNCNHVYVVEKGSLKERMAD